MSRAAIPSNKNNVWEKAYRQVCIYSFPKKILKVFRSPHTKTPFESIEDIEILRFIELGHEVRMIEMSSDSIAVDHIEDVEKVIKRLQNG
jgi:3-deoxy-manno-octulosonate cytidylyltransferase (CMP-KDO synthetase)